MQTYIKGLCLCLWWALFLNSGVLYTAGQDCGPPGNGRIEIAEGSSYNLTCTMCPSFFNGSNSSQMNYKELLPHEIEIVNETTIMYQLKNAKANQYTFTCCFGEHGIRETIVGVGTAPKPVKNFSCRSYDFTYMVCQYERPHNDVIVTYELSFYTSDPNYIHQPVCGISNTPLVVCNITNNTYQPSAVYHFTLMRRNSLGSDVQKFNINNHNVMKPGVPQNFHVRVLRDNYIKFSWSMSKLSLYDGKLEYEVVLKANNGVEQKSLNTGNRTSAFFNLAYAYYNYTLEIRAKMTLSNLWSEPFVYEFRTQARRPARPPNTKPGSFYIDKSETNVRIFWEKLEFKEHSGYDFGYVISQSSDGKFV